MTTRTEHDSRPPALPPSSHSRAPRIAAGVAAGVLSLALTVWLTIAPETFGLSASPGLFDRVRAEGRGGEAFIFAWALIAVPTAGLLQTPLALRRGARIGAGWAMLAAYWLYVVAMAPVAWHLEGVFPATDGPGKSGGIFGAAVLLVVSVPVVAAGWGAVFRVRVSPAQVRGHLAAVVILTSTFTGAVAGLTAGLAFAFPRTGAPAMVLPGGILWGLHAGAALGHAVAARVLRSGELSQAAVAYARTGAALFLCCLCVSQLGWVLPGWAVVLVGIPAPFVLLFGPWGGRWTESREVKLPKGAWD
ncbi:hypothetical protein ACWD11_03610 [Streptomyces sp. NPDC002776]